MTICSLGAGFAALLTAAWSKTSFALTLLRISNGKIKTFLWFVMITVNAVLAVSAAFQWVQCWPLQRLWDFRVAGVCWPKAVIYYDTAAAGKSLTFTTVPRPQMQLCPQAKVSISNSILWHSRHRSRSPSVENHLERINKQERACRGCDSNEYGCLVSLSHNGMQECSLSRTSIISAGIMSFLKLLPVSSVGTDDISKISTFSLLPSVPSLLTL